MRKTKDSYSVISVFDSRLLYPLIVSWRTHRVPSTCTSCVIRYCLMYDKIMCLTTSILQLQVWRFIQCRVGGLLGCSSIPVSWVTVTSRKTQPLFQLLRKTRGKNNKILPTTSTSIQNTNLRCHFPINILSKYNLVCPVFRVETLEFSSILWPRVWAIRLHVFRRRKERSGKIEKNNRTLYVHIYVYRRRALYIESAPS